MSCEWDNRGLYLVALESINFFYHVQGYKGLGRSQLKSSGVNTELLELYEHCDGSDLAVVSVNF